MEIPVSESSPSRSLKSRLRRQVLIPLRATTGAFRALPDTIIAGVQKGGTTPFFQFLSAHPQVMRGMKKESHFFDRHYARGLAWYRALYPLERTRLRREKALGLPVRVLDATPEFVFDPRAPARIGSDLPDARFALFLRDPVLRAYSNYQMMVARGYETLSFEDAMAAEPSRTAGEWQRMLADPLYVSQPVRLFGYGARSRYADQLERWFQHVPRETTLVIRSEDSQDAPDQAFRQVTDFLGIEPFEPPPFVQPNARSYPPLDPGLYRDLAAAFAEQNARLAVLLGREMEW